MLHDSTTPQALQKQLNRDMKRDKSRIQDLPTAVPPHLHLGPLTISPHRLQKPIFSYTESNKEKHRNLRKVEETRERKRKNR